MHNIFISYFAEMVGEEFVSPKRGVLTSPNFPHFYPQHVNSTETIQVTKGNVIKMQFRYFHTEGSRDYLWIVEDGVGHLTYKMQGNIDPRDVVSRTETVHVKFHANTDYYWKSWRSGWRMEWTEVPPVCAPNTTTLFSECPKDLRAPMSKWTWHGKSLATCEKKDGQLVGIESTEGNCLSCLSCDSEAARQAAEKRRELGGERCGGYNLGFRCLDDGVCWEEVKNYLHGFWMTAFSGVCLRWV